MKLHLVLCILQFWRIKFIHFYCIHATADVFLLSLYSTYTMWSDNDLSVIITPTYFVWSPCWYFLLHSVCVFH